MNRLSAAALAAAIFAATAGLAAPAFAQAKEIRFGCYLPLTGQMASAGKSMDNGFKMALADFEKAGTFKDAKFVIQCEDDQNRADDGINIARKFIEDKSIVLVLGSWSSTVTLAAGAVYNEAKLVNMTPISSHPDITKVGPYVFRQSVIQSKEGAANAEYMAKLGAKKIAMLSLPNDYGRANLALTKAAFIAKGGTVVFEEFVRPDAQDFRQVIQKAMREQPDMIYLGMFAPQSSLVVKQIKQLGITTPIFGASALDTHDMLRLSGDAANGMRLNLVFNPVIGPKMAEFFDRYEALYKQRPDPFAVNSYVTSTMMFGIVAKLYPNVTREGIRQALDAMRQVETVAGTLNYDPATREWDFKFMPGIIENGTFKAVTAN